MCLLLLGVSFPVSLLVAWVRVGNEKRRLWRTGRQTKKGRPFSLAREPDVEMLVFREPETE